MILNKYQMEIPISRYVFGYFRHDIGKWKICNRSFILNQNLDNQVVFGQYLSSNWFSYHTDPRPLKFVVLKIPKICFGKKIENIINYQNSENFIHDFIEDTSLFCLEEKEIDGIFQKIKKKNGSDRIEIYCSDDDNKKLCLRFHYLKENDCLIVSLPEIHFN